jgi:hypothetical protein
MNTVLLLGSECLATGVTLKGFFTCVNAHVIIFCGFGCKTLMTYFTGVVLDSYMHNTNVS